jgi:CspA family cold shock protein
MIEGTIAHFNDDRGFGFIALDDGGADVFVHARDLVNADTLKRDQRVTFEVVNDSGHNKPRAANVRVI